MKTLKIDFTNDYITGGKIPIAEYREKLKEIKGVKRNFYFSEIADFYYKEKYNNNILFVLSKNYDIPKCPISGEYVSYSLRGSIVFGQFSSNVSMSKRNKYIAENNEYYKAHVERMKIDRGGDGNPMYGRAAWNDGLTRFSDNRIMKMSNNRIGTHPTEKTKKRQSDSAKKRKIHGHTGIKHSEESKQIMREKTIARFKKNEFPQTNSLPHKLVKELCEQIFGKLGECFFEEFSYGGFVFDFKVNEYLIEVQGDYFHCNPNTRHAIPKNDMQKNNLERDNRKRNFVKESGEYILIELWEYDIINNIEKIKQCLKNLKK